MEFEKCDLYPRCTHVQCECHQLACTVSTLSKVEPKPIKDLPKILTIKDMRKLLKKNSNE